MVRTKKNSHMDRNLESRAFSSLDVATITGVSLRQLQWWDEQGVVTPVQRGHRRLYQLGEVVEVALITELRRKGVSLQKIRRVLKFLKRELGDGFVDAVHYRGEVHLLTDGQNLYLENDHGNIVDILKNASQPMISVCVSDQVERLTAKAALKKTVQSERAAAAPARRGARAS